MALPSTPAFPTNEDSFNFDKESQYYPLKRVPNEIWAIIFVHSLPFDTSPDNKPAEEILRDPRLMPMALASVCMTWRRVACSTPELWATCWVNFQQPQLNTIWLERAGSRMLHLYGRYHRCIRTNFDWKALFQSILPFQKRWKSLVLETGLWGNFTVYLPEFDAPSLEVLKLPRGSKLSSYWRWSILSNAPQLREMELDYWETMPRLNLSFLTSLKLANTSPRGVMDILSSLPQLKILHAFIGEGGSQVPRTTIKHTSLVRLQLGGGFLPLRILDDINAPSLYNLRMISSFSFTAFNDFDLRSGCHITELGIGHNYLTGREIVIALESVPSLEKLEICGFRYCLTRDFLDFLKYSENNQTLPHLTHLSIFDGEFEDIQEGDMADIIMSRCRGIVCECVTCLTRTQVRKVQLEYVNIGDLPRATHGLDIARLIPLPEDRAVNPKNTSMTIDLVALGVGAELLQLGADLGQISSSMFTREVCHSRGKGIIVIL